jgi:hypothetical protein
MHIFNVFAASNGSARMDSAVERAEKEPITSTWQAESMRVRARVQQKIEALKEYTSRISTPPSVTEVRCWQGWRFFSTGAVRPSCNSAMDSPFVARFNKFYLCI